MRRCLNFMRREGRAAVVLTILNYYIFEHEFVKFHRFGKVAG